MQFSCAKSVSGRFVVQSSAGADLPCWMTCVALGRGCARFSRVLVCTPWNVLSSFDQCVTQCMSQRRFTFGRSLNCCQLSAMGFLTRPVIFSCQSLMYRFGWGP